MVKCGLSTVFHVFPIEFDSAGRTISLLFKNNGLNICLVEKSIFDVNLNWEYMPQTF